MSEMAQVGDLVWHLRHKTPFCAFCWRRSPTVFLTCAIQAQTCTIYPLTCAKQALNCAIQPLTGAKGAQKSKFQFTPTPSAAAGWRSPWRASG